MSIKEKYILLYSTSRNSVTIANSSFSSTNILIELSNFSLQDLDSSKFDLWNNDSEVL